MARKSKIPASPKQLVQRSRYVYKGFLTSTQVNAKRWMNDKNTTTYEKIKLIDMLVHIGALINRCDEATALMIGRAR